MKKNLIGIFLGVAICMTVFGSTCAEAADVDVEIINVTHGIYFTPFLVSAHGPTFHLFEAGLTASANLQAMAEGGDISGLSTDLGGADDDTVENPAAGLLGPGMSTMTNIDTDVTGNMYLSIVAMMLPTNDGFVGADSMMIPTTPGTYTYYLNAYDAGTEVNDELITGGGAPGVPGIPVDPGGMSGTGGTGVTTLESNTMVHLHRGALGDDDLMAGVSDLDNTVHRFLNPVVKLVLTVN